MMPTFLANHIDPLIIFSADGKIIEVNAAFLNYFQLSPSSLRKQPHLFKLLNIDEEECSGIGTYHEVEFTLNDLVKGHFLIGIHVYEENRLAHLKDMTLEKNLHQKYQKQILDLKNLIENQEKIIDQRTSELKEMFFLMKSSLGSLNGEVVVLNQDQTPVALFPEKPLPSSLGSHLKLTFEENSYLSNWLEQVFSKNDTWEMLNRISPEKYVLSERVFALDYYPIWIEKRIDKLIAVIRDITEREELEVALKKQEELAHVLLRVMKGKINFPVFLQTQAFLIQNLKTHNDKVKIRRDLHGLKGLISSFGFKITAEKIHKLENEFMHYSQDEFQEKLKSLLKDYHSTLEHLIEIVGDDALLKNNSTGLSWSDFFSEWNKTLEVISKEKNFHFVLQVKGELFSQVPAYIVNALTICLSHYGRNLVAHAFRIGVANQLNVHLTCEDDLYSLEILDDGLGTNKEDVFLQKDVESSFNADLTSGRGIGMYAIKNTLEEVGGKVEFKSTLGKGSSLILKFTR
jgi:PAS domain-containing protein/anti-sigma regulatory factor (Ser/Thr protein kinase)